MVKSYQLLESCRLARMYSSFYQLVKSTDRLLNGYKDVCDILYLKLVTYRSHLNQSHLSSGYTLLI